MRAKVAKALRNGTYGQDASTAARGRHFALEQGKGAGVKPWIATLLGKIKGDTGGEGTVPTELKGRFLITTDRKRRAYRDLKRGWHRVPRRLRASVMRQASTARAQLEALRRRVAQAGGGTVATGGDVYPVRSRQG